MSGTTRPNGPPLEVEIRAVDRNHVQIIVHDPGSKEVKASTEVKDVHRIDKSERGDRITNWESDEEFLRRVQMDARHFRQVARSRHTEHNRFQQSLRSIQDEINNS